MKQKGLRYIVYAALTLLLCIQTVFNFGTDQMTVTAEAASKTIAFASSLKEEAVEAAKKAGADEDAQIVIADTNKYLKVYSSRKTSSKVKGYLYSGSGAVVVKTKGKWSYISSGDVTGWVKSKNLLSGDEGSQLMAEKDPKVATVDCSNLNVREDTTTKSNILINLKRGEQVVVISKEGNWTKVRASKDTVGYIYTKYADLENGLALGVTAKAEAAAADEIEERQAEVEQEKSSDNESQKWVCLGTFKITAYCGCAKCNGSANVGKTASGAKPKAGYTVAVDRSVISLGTKLRLGSSSKVYKAQDTGVRGNKIDVYFKSHSSALKFGVKKLKVYAYVG